MRSLSLQALRHLAANAIMLWLGYYWLGVPESRAMTLAWSACIAVFVLLCASWTYGSGFVYFKQSDERPAATAWRTSLRHVLPFALAALVIVLLYWLLARWGEYSTNPAFRIASWLTLKVRKPVRPASVLRVFNAVLWLVRWVVLPVLCLPILSAIAQSGWRGFSAFGSKARRWVYWLATPVLLLCAVKVPLLLLHWVPRIDSFSVQMMSFAVRAAVAYLLFGCAWLLLAFVTAVGSPRGTQPSTAVSP